MRNIRKLIRRLVNGKPIDYVEHLRSLGVRIGERTVFYDSHNSLVDVTRPWLVEIGNDVQITRGVIILTHGYDWSVLKGLYGHVLGSAGKVTIGNNVFIGMNTIILKGVTIGNNVIIGAGSLVNSDIPDNSVAAGNPARVIMSIEDYYEKRKAAQEKEAKQLVFEYRKVYGKDPDEAVLSEFFWLFSDEPDSLPECWQQKMELVGTKSLSCKKLSANPKPYRDLQDFLKHCE